MANKLSKTVSIKKIAKVNTGNQGALREDDLARVSGGITITKTVDKPTPK
jgi:hypothetical protein